MLRRRKVCTTSKLFEMKRSLLLAFALAGFITSLAGQDRIITSGFDTIDCRITRITRSLIFFDVSTHGVKASGRVPLKDVYSYHVMPSAGAGKMDGNKKDQDLIQESEQGLNQEPERTYDPMPEIPVESGIRSGSLRISLNGGFGYITGNSEEAEDAMISFGVSSGDAGKYYNDLKTGIYGSADITWLFNQRYGAGLRYKFLNTGALTEGYFNPGDEYNLYYTTYSENIYVSYGGLSLSFIEPAGRKGLLSLTSSISAGMTFYRDEMEILSEALLVTGKAPGMDLSIGFEYRIAPFMSAGADVSFFASSLRKITITDGVEAQTHELEKENYENLSRLEVAFGIRFYLWNK